MISDTKKMFLSTISSLRRVSSVDETNNDFDEYRKHLEDAKRANPHLSIGAQQQIALKKYAEDNPDRKSSSLSSKSLGDSIEAFKTILKLDRDGVTDARKTGARAFSHSSVVSAPSERSFAPKESVVLSSEDHDILLRELDDTRTSGEVSLADSLENIEQSSSRNASQFSFGSSGNYDGSDGVEEKSMAKNQAINNNEGDESDDVMPIEIRLVVDKFDNFDPKNDCLSSSFKVAPVGNPRPRRGKTLGTQNAQRRPSLRSSGGSIHSSLFSSIDSDTFEGDFWAWCDQQNPNSETFEGDFWAWCDQQNPKSSSMPNISITAANERESFSSSNFSSDNEFTGDFSAWETRRKTT